MTMGSRIAGAGAMVVGLSGVMSERLPEVSSQGERQAAATSNWSESLQATPRPEFPRARKLDSAGDEAKKASEPKQADDLSSQLQTQLQKLIGSHSNAILNGSFSPERPEDLVNGTIRDSFRLRKDTKVTMRSSVIFSYVDDKKFAAQPFQGEGAVTITIGEGEAAAVIVGNAVYSPGKPPTLTLVRHNLAEKSVRAGMVVSTTPEGFARLYTAKDVVSLDKDAKADAIRLVLGVSERFRVPDGSKLADPEGLAADPKLANLGAVFRTIEKDLDDSKFSTFPLVTRVDKAEAAMWATRRLATEGKEVTAASIKAALGTIDGERKTLATMPLFEGRSVVFAADSQDLRGLRPKSRLDDELVLRWRGDSNLFGTRRTISDLQKAVGNEGSVKLIREAPSYEARVERLLNAFHRTVEAAPEPGKKFNDNFATEMPTLKAQLRQTLGVSEKADFDLKLTLESPDKKSREGRLIATVDGEDILELDIEVSSKGVVSKGGYLTTRAFSSPLPVIFAKEAKDAVLKAIETTPPGKNGFLFIFEGHGDPEHLSLSSNSVDARGNIDGNAFITRTELAEAWIKRSKNFDTSRDLCVVLACNSRKFIDGMAEKFTHTMTSPYLYGSAEYGQLGGIDVDRSASSSELSTLLPRATAASKKEGTPPSVFDLANLFNSDIKELFTNPSMLAPRRDATTGRVEGYGQISGNPIDVDVF